MLACLHCGRELSPRAVACPQCGEPGPAAPPSRAAGIAAPAGPPPAPAVASARSALDSAMSSVNRTEPYAIAAIICAVVNFFGFFLVGAILAVVFGKMAESRIAANPGLDGAGLAKVAIIVGWVGVAVFGVMLLLGFTMFGLFGALFSSIDLPVNFTS